jgi:phosphoribosylanthranilate isomerase
VSLRVKICGLTRERDAAAVAEAGALYVGAVLVPDSPREVRPSQARRIFEAAGLPLVIVVADREPDELAKVAEETGARVIQLHGDESEAVCRRLRELGDWELWKAVRVRKGDEILPAAHRWSGVVDGVLLDGWHPRQLGGSGVRFPWGALEAIRREWPSDLSLIAAGGLNPDNVEEAVRRLRPHVVDVSSGVEHAPGIKDPEAIRSFVERAASAYPDLSKDPEDDHPAH